jgi:hypothetical protein
LPGDPGDFSNWGDPLGTATLFVEGSLMLTAATTLIHFRLATPTASPYAATSTDAQQGTGAGVVISA